MRLQSSSPNERPSCCGAPNDARAYTVIIARSLSRMLLTGFPQIYRLSLETGSGSSRSAGMTGVWDRQVQPSRTQPLGADRFITTIDENRPAERLLLATPRLMACRESRLRARCDVLADTIDDLQRDGGGRGASCSAGTVLRWSVEVSVSCPLKHDRHCTSFTSAVPD